MNTLDLTNQTLLSLTMDWISLLREKDVHWEKFYKTPLWRKWQDKQTGNGDEYESVHKVQDFDSPLFQKMIQMMKSEHPSMHKYHTPEVHEALEKVIRKDVTCRVRCIVSTRVLLKTQEKCRALRCK